MVQMTLFTGVRRYVTRLAVAHLIIHSVYSAGSFRCHFRTSGNRSHYFSMQFANFRESTRDKS